jgi:putative lipoic acid-binding regulatory protein
MQVPRDRIELKPSFRGRESPAGWLAIRIKGLDLEAVDALYVDLADVETLRAKQSDAEALFRRLADTLGADDD